MIVHNYAVKYMYYQHKTLRVSRFSASSLDMHMYTDERLATIWRASKKEVMKLTLPEDCIEYYDVWEKSITYLISMNFLLVHDYITHTYPYILHDSNILRCIIL